ncbi:MAG: serine hydrolase domain-containing protein, partial [Cyanobacteriota bacterium]|nr:serine hydrolase domain-containing protein [Cyanobacteriota bacterium]
DWSGADFALGHSFDPATRSRLERALLEAMERTKARVMSAAVATSEGFWETTRAADGSLSPLKLYWASAGKTLTATIIMQLVEEGKLSLDDPLSRWMPEFPNASSIAIEDLLQHTAGIFSFNEDSNVRRNGRYVSPDEAIAIAAKHGAMFCPGRRWRYSNTGYTLLGKIIEQIEQRPYHEVVNARIRDRLQLTGLRALAPLERLSGIAPLTPTDSAVSAIEPSWPYAAGNVVGSAADLVRFWHALLAAKLTREESVDLMFEQLYPMFDRGTFYGRGVMLYVLNETLGSPIWLGHRGGTPGAKAVVAFSVGDRAFVAVALTGEGLPEATANLLLEQLSPLEESNGRGKR